MGTASLHFLLHQTNILRLDPLDENQADVEGY